MKRKSLLILLLLAAFAPWTTSFAQQALPYEYGFDTSLEDEGWTSYGLHSSSTINNGAFRFRWKDIDPDDPSQFQYIFSKELDGTNGINVQFSYKIESTNYPETFKVGYSNTTNSYDAFSWFSAVTATNATYQDYSSPTPCPAGTKYVAICYMSDDQYYLYVDNISFTAPSTDPYISLAPASETVLTGFTKTLTATYGNVTGTPTITYTSSNEGVATVSGNGTTATVTGVAPGTATITATMNYQGTDYTATAAITVEDPSHCQPSFSSSESYNLYITSFTTEGGINNSTGFSAGGYGNYYDTHAATHEPGETVNFTVSQGATYGSGFAIWVDWNQDYEFSSDERVAVTTSTITTTSWSGSFTVGTDKPVGDYRMRVLMQYSTASPSNPCVSAYYGEGEDYKLSVVAPSDCPRTNSLTAQATGDQAVLSWTSTATAWQVCVNDDEDNLIEVTENPYTLENLTLSTDYTVKVRANCTASGDGYGDWSNIASFTTGICAADDMCAITYTLTDKYGDGWNDNKMEVRNSSTNELIATWTLSSGGSTTGTLSVCEGITLDFVYVASGNYQYENGWTITDINEEIISTHEGCSNSADCDAPTAGTIATYTVNCTVPTCIKPTMNATAANIEATEATVSWTAGGTNQDHWDVYYSTTNTAPTASTVPQIAYTTDNPCTLTGLSASTTYYVWVRGNCGTEEEPDYSDWSAAYCTFTTTEYCADLKVDYYTIEFTDYTSSGVTVNWTAAGDATQWRVQVFDLQTSPYELKDEQVVTAPTATIDGLQSQLGYQVDIAPYCAEADDYTPTVSNSFSTLDDCPSPTDLAANDVTASSASISWTNNGLTEFNLRYSCDQTVTWIDKPNVTSPCTIDELPANTKIYVQVQGTCDATNDRWEEMTFFTSCGAFTVDADNDFSESFDTNFPDCWSNPSEYINNYNRQWARSTNQNHTTTSGSGSAYSGYYGPIYMMLPELAIADYKTDVKLTFWSYNTHTGDYTSAKQARNSVVLIDGTNETELWYAESVSSSWEESPAIDLSAYKGETIRLAFKYEGSNAHGWYVDDVKVAFDPTCLPVGTLAEATEVKSTSAKLSWALTDDTQTSWDVAVKAEGDADFTIRENEADTNQGFLLEGLEPETTYTVKVRANCGAEDGSGAWSNTITFTTASACMKPTEINADNITSVSADLTWTGESDGYNIEYWTAGYTDGTTETFASSSTPTGWSKGTGVLNNDGTATIASASNYSSWLFNSSDQVFDNHAYFNMYGNNNNWLITPSLSITEGYALSFDVAYTGYNYNGNNVSPNTGGPHKLYVLISTDEMAHWTVLREWNNTGSEYVLDEISNNGQTISDISLDVYVGETANIAFLGVSSTTNYDNNIHIDNVSIGKSVAPGAVQTATSTTHSVALEGLEAGKTYEVKVQGLCGSVEGEWSNVYEFTTMAEGNKVFVAEGNWNEDANWRPQGAPALTDNVIIRANTTITSDCVALANEMTVEGENTVTIEDGGQLLHSNSGVKATMKKDVEPYNDATGFDNYIFLASPIFTPTSPANVVNMISSTQPYDLYRFDQTEDLEWRNYEADGGEFDLVSGTGYLYAHNYGATTTLSFTGELLGSLADKSVNLDYISGKNWAGWNLIGNPFACNANVSINAEGTFNYYTIDANGDFVDADGPVAPMEGIFVEATAVDQQAVFTRVVPGETSVGPTDGILNVNLMSNEAATRKGNSRIDMARLRFGHGNNLSKLNLFRSNAIVFFPQNGKDYGVMYAEAQGEMPLHFKTEKNGTYTLGFTTEDVSFGYLHLIDNLTGTDVDLLATPSYSFDARTTDYASRFRLVFSANGSNSDDNGSFAFIDAAGNIVITGAEAGTVMQIMDVTGRMILSTNVARNVSTNGMAPGVYMLRLINGTNVKTQKIVVK